MPDTQKSNMAAETGSSYSSVPTHDVSKIATARYMFSCTAIQVDKSATTPDIARRLKHVRDIVLHCPTPQKIQYFGGETGSCYIYTSSQDI